MNSLLNISNQTDWYRLVSRCSLTAARLGVRATFLTYDKPAMGFTAFATDVSAVYMQSCSSTDRADRISALLGAERRSLIFSIGSAPDTGLLAAAAGTVVAGGWILLDLSECGASAITDGAPLPQFPSQFIPAVPFCRSARRLVRLARQASLQHPETVFTVELSRYSDGVQPPVAFTQAPQIPPLNHSPINSDAQSEQDELFRRACDQIASSRESCLLIKGRRGRGKSSLLARIASHLKSLHIDFTVTSLNPAALSSFEKLSANYQSRYIAAQAVLAASPDVLLVDEAASLPVSLLRAYLAQCRHLVLCTTTEGYETSGRAFDVRLTDELHCGRKRLLVLEPHHPWRWTREDPLEKFIDQLLLKNRRTDDLEPSESLDAQAIATRCHATQVSQDELANNETLLFSVHSLLDNSHYQSTTKDLTHLLDAPSIQIWVQRYADRVCAVLLAEQEGEIEPGLHHDILIRRRRLHNQLLPQLLAQTADCTKALGKRYLRVVRLAVSPSLRRQRLASSLLTAFIDANTNTPDVESTAAIGASFASDRGPMAFWQHHGFTEFHRGFKANPRTGKVAIAVMRSFESITKDVLTKACTIHTENRTAHEATALIATQIAPIESLSTQHLGLLKRFVSGHRSMIDTYAALLCLARLHDFSMTRQVHESQRQFERTLRERVEKLIS